MTKSAYVFLYLVLFIPFWGCAQSTFEASIRQADRIATQVFEDEQFPGMAVAVAYDGVVIWEKGYGFANVEEHEAVEPDASLFRVGSVSKTLTSIALAKLVEDGKLDLDKEIQEYVPDFPKKEYPITTRQVAGHIAGIRHYKGVEFMSNKYYPDVKSSLDIFKDDPLLFEPGSKYAYSSYGWNLISAVIEGASGMPFLDYMQIVVFNPAGMENTHPEYPDKYEDQKVQFYIKENGENYVAPEVDNSYKWAGGGFIGTARDLLRFSKAVADTTIIQADTYQEWTTSQQTKDGKATNYGIGWRMSEDKKGRNWVGHSGGSMGGTTMFLVYPEEKLTVVTLVNLSGAKMNNLAWRIAEQFLTVIEAP